MSDFMHEEDKQRRSKRQQTPPQTTAEDQQYWTEPVNGSITAIAALLEIVEYLHDRQGQLGNRNCQIDHVEHAKASHRIESIRQWIKRCRQNI